MTPKYCYWSVATGSYAVWMERCAASARAVGVNKEFHVMADRAIAGCECYDAMEVDLQDGMAKLVYLKAAISKLHFDHYVWIDADTIFTGNPDPLLSTLGRGPIHVPLGERVDSLRESAALRGLSPARYLELMRKAGVYNHIHASRSAFWIVKRAAVDVVCELAQHHYAVTKTCGEAPHSDAALGYAMQMLCGDPQKHLTNRRPDLWWSDETGDFAAPDPLTDGWDLRASSGGRRRPVPPALVHLPARRRREMSAFAVAGEADTRTGLIV